MSLVNYGSSDESSDNEGDSIQVENVARPMPAQDSQGDVERSAPAPSPKPSGPSIDMEIVGPRPMANETRRVGVDEPIRKRSLLSSLPPPKSSKPIKELPFKNDHVTKKLAEVDSSTNIKRSFLNLPPPKKKSQTVKITLPSLPDPGSDDEEPVAKKPTPSKGVSGLLSMLPKPKSAMSSRILVPHTVSRRPQPSKPKPQLKPTPKKTSTTVASVISADYGSDDDDEGEASSFFSLGASTLLSEVSSSSKDNDKLQSTTSLPSLPPTTLNTGYLNADSSSVRLDNIPKPTVNIVNVSMLPESSSDSSRSSSSGRSKENPTSTVSSSISTRTSDTSIASTSSTEASPYNVLSSTSNVGPGCNPSHNTNIADAPLSFNTSHSHTSSGYGHVTSSYYGNYDYSGNYYQGGESAYEYNQPYQDTSEYQACPDSTAVESTQQGIDQDTNEDDEQLQLRRFLGKQRTKEDINMISISADDQTAGSNTREALLKSMSEEKQTISYSKKKNSDLPSSQQRRKHQITYLAFQAKERELALKNQWSHNRMTRKQTQAKYGF